MRRHFMDFTVRGQGPSLFRVHVESAESVDIRLSVFLVKPAVDGSAGKTTIVDVENPRDTSLIGSATYTMENLQVGGGEQLDQADPLGALSKTLGEGEWNLRIEGAEGCSNEITVDVEAGVLLEMCIPLYCTEE